MLLAAFLQFINCIFVEQEVKGDDTSALDAVVGADRERAWLLDEERVCDCIILHKSSV